MTSSTRYGAVRLGPCDPVAAGDPLPHSESLEDLPGHQRSGPVRPSLGRPALRGDRAVLLVLTEAGTQFAGHLRRFAEQGPF
ncbi:MAG: hypothetical protein ABSH29_09585 [Acidimicrobiales bacterium]